MSIEQELREGSIIISVDEDNNEVITRRPPTSKELRAANKIKELAQVCAGLNSANITLQTEIDRLNTELERVSGLLLKYINQVEKGLENEQT